MMIEIAAVVVAFSALGFTLFSLRRAQEKIATLESDLDALEGHNRTLADERDTLKSTLAETSQALDSTKKSLEASEAEKREVEQQRATLAETAARLEKARAELESELAKLRREQESLERRVIDFQGQWSHQLTTLEAEISTLIRQLGEFRKGTQLPIVRPDATVTADVSPALVPPTDPNWAFSAPVGPRLATTRPRPVSPEIASADSVPAPSTTVRFRP